MPLVSGVCRKASAPTLPHGGSRLNASKPEASPKTRCPHTHYLIKTLKHLSSRANRKQHAPRISPVHEKSFFVSPRRSSAFLCVLLSRFCFVLWWEITFRFLSIESPIKSKLTMSASLAQSTYHDHKRYHTSTNKQNKQTNAETARAPKRNRKRSAPGCSSKKGLVAHTPKETCALCFFVRL